MKTKSNVLKKLLLFTAAFAFCAVLCAKPMDVKAALAAPTGIKQVDASTSYADIEWTAVSGAYKYGIMYSTNANFAGATESNVYSNSKLISGTAGTTYYVKLRTYSSSAATSYGPWSATFKVDIAPKNITWIKQTAAKEKSVTASWSPVTGATGYLVLKALPSDTSYTAVTTTANTSYTLSVPKNSKYYIAVIPYRNSGNVSNFAALYPTSYPIEVACKSLPTKAKSLQVIGGNPDTKTLKFYWKATSSTANTDGFQVEVYQLKKNGKTKKIKKTTTTYNYVNISNAKMFKNAIRFRVRPYVKMSNGKTVYGSWSSYCNYVPQAMQTKVSVLSRSAATLKWTKVANAASYDIYYKTSSSDSASWKRVAKGVKGTSYTVPLNYYGRSYYYIKSNKVKFGKKKLNSVAPKKAPFWYYWS